MIFLRLYMNTAVVLECIAVLVKDSNRSEAGITREKYRNVLLRWFTVPGGITR